MATGALDANGVWIYGEDDSETTFSALLNKLGDSIGDSLKGRIKQVVTGSTSTAVSSTSTTLFDSGLTATITPTSASSIILVMVTQLTRISFAGSTGSLRRFRIALDRSGTLIWDSSINRYSEFTMATVTNPSRTDILNLSFIDSPATTSAITYKTQGSNDVTTGTIQFNAILGAAGTAHITLMEISA